MKDKESKNKELDKLLKDKDERNQALEMELEQAQETTDEVRAKSKDVS